MSIKSKLFLGMSLILLLSVCSSDRNSGGEITLTLWQFWTDPGVKPVLTGQIERFEKENPGIKVKVTDLTWSNGHEKIVVAFGSNSAPDVLELGSDWVPEFAYQGALYDVTVEVDSIMKFYRMWQPAMVDNKVFGFPWILDTRVLFYNKKLLAEAGFNPNSFPATWGELLAAVKKIHNPGNKIYGFGANSAEKHRLYKKFLPFMWSNDGLILSPDGKQCWLDSRQVREALEFYTELTKSGLIDTQRRLDEEFISGKVGFVISGGWLLQEIRKNKPDLDFGVCLMPRPTQAGGIPASFAGGEYLVINKNSRHPGPALRLIRFLTDLDNSLEFCKSIGTPSPSHALAALDPYYDKDPFLAVFQEQLNFSKSPPVHPKWVRIEEEIEKAVEQAMYQKKTPRQALDQAKQNIDRILTQ